MTLEKREEGKVYVDIPHHMELRDWFAGMAMVSDFGTSDNMDSDDFASGCYYLADAMMRERGER